MSTQKSTGILIAFCLILLCNNFKAGAQLIVNEFSQGASGNKEYIELLVKGQATCNDSCFDLRGWIFDDNNGWYGTTAISPGSYRFSNDANWSCVPYGSLIVVYNSGDLNANLPPDDPTDSNNDKVYVVPVNSSYIELHNTLPSSASNNYPSSGFGASGTWTNMALNNSNDAVQTVAPTALTVSFHAVSYGSGVVAPVHINSSGSQKVYYLTNDQYNTSAAWTAGDVPADETPGLPNTAANGTWINSMSGPGGGGAYNDTFTVTICQGDSYTFRNNTYNTTGYYTEIFPTNAGCDSIVTLDLQVNPIPAPPAVVSPVTYCQNEVATALSATGTDLLWYEVPSGGTGNTVAPTPSTVIADTLVYYVSQTIGGCESPRNSISVIVNAQPFPPVVISPVVICQGSAPVVLTAQGQDLKWYNQPTGGIAVTIAPVINTDDGHTESWYVTQTINGCESERAHIEVRVSSIHADFTLNVDTLCISDTLFTTNLSVNNNDINYWDFGDGFSYVSLNYFHMYSQPGIYTVMLAAGNSDGCTDTARRQVWVSPVPDLRLSLDKNNLCTGDKVIFNMDYTTGFSRLSWDFGDGNGETLDDRDNETPNSRGHMELQHAYETEGQYYIKTTAYTPGCELLENLDSIYVHPMPKVNLGPDSVLCLHGAPILLKNAFDPGPDETYVWSTGATTPTIEARHHGDFMLTVHTPYCSNSDEVHIAKDCYVDIPNAFTPNGDGFNDYFFPRQLLSSSVSEFHMKVLNRWGQAIFETTSVDGRGWDGQFNGTPQPQGVYIYLIRTDFRNGRTESYQGNVTLIR